MRTAIGVYRCQRHGIGFHRWLFSLHRVVEPLAKQCERLVRGLSFRQAITGVIAAHIGQGLGHCCVP
ncbi:hypothetical protein D3C75_1105420 [compost metagenome]